MLSGFFAEYISACLVMGVGIGLDAALATSSQSQLLKTKRAIIYWIGGLSLTHTLFPLIGYAISYLSLQAAPQITPIVGVLACSFILYFIYGEFVHALNGDDGHENETSLLVSLGVVLAVSWDALWSGPAKSAQVIGWPELAIWTSFLLVGLVVFGLTVSAWLLSVRISENYQGIQLSFQCQSLFKFLQFSVLLYFAGLALIRYSLGLSIPSLVIFSSSAVITLAGMVFIYAVKQKNSVIQAAS